MTTYDKMKMRGVTYKNAKKKAKPLYIDPDGVELWKTIPHLDGLCYEASNKGRIRRASDKRICPTSVQHCGYHIAFLHDTRPRTIAVASAVWRAWRPFLPVGAGTGLELDHIDGRKENCALDNLRPVPRKINCAKNGHAVQIGETIYPTITEAARGAGVCPVTLRDWLRKGRNPQGVAVAYADGYAGILLGQTARL